MLLRMAFYATLGVMVLIPIAVLGLIGYFVWLEWRPPLVRDLPADTREVQAAFNERVRAKFPIEMSVTTVKNELKAQSFDLVQQRATFKRAFFPCATYWYISWRADETDRLTHIEGTYYQACV